MKTQTATEEKGLSKLQIKAIAHYDRMIAWARTQPYDDKPDSSDMFAAIGEYWFGKSCSFCQKYFNAYKNDRCTLCPLNDGVVCCGGRWLIMNSAETWGDWVRAAEKVKEYIIEHGGVEK